MISVAMALYNGEKYLHQQLESIYSQTIHVDELYARDDGSTDNTEQIFNRFVTEKNLHNKWHLIKNEKNFGPMLNFIKCAELCNGDVIFYSDQDDIWDCRKIEKMMHVFSQNADALAVCCGISYIDTNGNLIKRLEKYSKSKRVKKIDIKEQIKCMYSPGLTLALKKELLPEVSKHVQYRNLTYDITTGLVASVKNGMYRLEMPLVNRRIHGENASSPSFSVRERSEHYKRYIDGRKLQLQHLEVIFNNYKYFIPQKSRYFLKKRIEVDKKSIDSLQRRSLLELVIQLLSFNPLDNKKIRIGNIVLAFLEKVKE